MRDHVLFDDEDESEWRKKLYFGYHEHAHCVLFQLLDNIHCYLYHSTLKMHPVLEVDNDSNQMSNRMMASDAIVFGADFTYYDEMKAVPHFVNAAYGNLKDELLNNPYRVLRVEQYFDHYLKAFNLLRSDYVRGIRSRDDLGHFGRSRGTEGDDPLSINHMLSVLVYCNEPKMR